MYAVYKENSRSEWLNLKTHRVAMHLFLLGHFQLYYHSSIDLQIPWTTWNFMCSLPFCPQSQEFMAVNFTPHLTPYSYLHRSLTNALWTRKNAKTHAEETKLGSSANIYTYFVCLDISPRQSHRNWSSQMHVGRKDGFKITIISVLSLTTGPPCHWEWECQY